MTKCMSCVFWHCKVTEYPCNACKVIVADADRSYFAEKKLGDSVNRGKE